MNVNKIQINRNKINGGGYLNIPIDISFDTVDKSDTVKTEYFDVEIEKAINPITDFEKVRFTPLIDGSRINTINFSVNLVNNGVISNNSKLSDLGFTQEDLFFRKPSFTNSFLRLSLYDTDKLTTQKLMSFYTIHLKILDEYILPSPGGVMSGAPMLVTTIPITFRVKNPAIFLNEYSEGFNIYHYRDEVNLGAPLELFMRASLANAKNGVVYNLMTENTAQSIDNLVHVLHMKYVLKRDSTGFYYEIDTDYSNNVVVSSNEISISLYETLSL